MRLSLLARPVDQQRGRAPLTHPLAADGAELEVEGPGARRAVPRFGFVVRAQFLFAAVGADEGLGVWGDARRRLLAGRLVAHLAAAVAAVTSAWRSPGGWRWTQLEKSSASLRSSSQQRTSRSMKSGRSSARTRARLILVPNV
jgi:hypothetical protein